MSKAQRAAVAPVRESERSKGGHRHDYVPAYGTAKGSKQTPVRCQVWSGSANDPNSELIHVAPLRVDDDGNIDDVVFTAGHAVRIDRLAFVWGSRVYAFRLPEPQVVKAGQKVQFALAHLKLVDKFGRHVLGAGKQQV